MARATLPADGRAFGRRLYPYARVPAQDLPPQRHPVVVVGGGPVGLALALDLGQRGTPVLLLDDKEGAGEGSRAICFAKRTLEICDRLGLGARMREKGVVWQVGKVFHGPDKVFEFDLLPETGHLNPAFVNIQQPYVEEFLVDAIRHAQSAGCPIELRGGNAVAAVDQQADHVSVTVETEEGAYILEADWLVACDGARSPVRGMLGLGFEGRVFEDNFLIADVTMEADFPTERWFWFDPPFKQSGQSALLHKQPDGLWRLDFQLGREIDKTEELREENVRRRIEAMLGPDVTYSLEWTSIYTFQCRRIERFRDRRVLFAGDSAHQVSPFGARGANSGMQDADNLGWKLDLVSAGRAPERLLDSYCDERTLAANENILNSTRSTDFITPKSGISRTFRNAVLALAARHEFARPFVNSGRLSVPSVYEGSALNGPDALGGPDRTRPGAPCPDAPFRDGFLLSALRGRFSLLAFDTAVPAPLPDDLETLVIDTRADDPSGMLRARYLGDAPQAIYLLRPDQHVTARWPSCQPADVAAALRRAMARGA